MATKQFYMELALSLAEAVVGQTSPNPAVGCVIVKDGSVVGMGAHLKAGDDHAEVIALKEAGKKAYGADMYVTLEPCSHHGRKPPCTDSIISHQIRNVFVATKDPNPLVAGKGIEKLLQAGVRVETAICEEQAKQINKYFFHYMKTKLPFVTLKTAVTLDGKTATSTGDSKWITSEAARLDVHQYRHVHDAILTGVNTVIHDNPHLTTRLPQGGKNPIRIILDTQLSIPLDANVIQDQQAETMIVCGREADEKREEAINKIGVRVKRMNTDKIKIGPLLKWLGEMQIMSLFVEGGSTVHGSFIDEDYFEEIITYIAPKVIADYEGYHVMRGRPKQWMKESRQLQFKSIESIGPDIKIVAVRKE